MSVLLGVDLRVSDHRWLVERAGWYASNLGLTLDLLFVGVEEKGARTQERLQELLNRLPSAARGRTIIRQGPVAKILLDQAKFSKLLVVGSRVPTALERILRGPLAAQLLGAAPCAVLVPKGESGPGAHPKVLVGVDLESATAGQVLSLAGPWAQSLGGKIHALYTLNERLPHIANAAVKKAAEREWLRSRRPTVEKLEKLMSAELPEEVRGEAVLGRGVAEDVLVAQSAISDLLVVGNRARQGISGFFLGDVGQQVIKRSKCDVLSLPTRQSD